MEILPELLQTLADYSTVIKALQQPTIDALQFWMLILKVDRHFKNRR
jgi:hypothetical protein